MDEQLEFFRPSEAGRVHVFKEKVGLFDGPIENPLEALMAKSKAYCGVVGKHGQIDFVGTFEDDEICWGCFKKLNADQQLAVFEREYR